MNTRMHAGSRFVRGLATTLRPNPRRLGTAAVLALLAGLGPISLAQPGRAQGVFDDDILPPRAVVWRLADRGFTGIGRPRFDGRAYVVEAFGPNGARLRLVVDPEDGEILARQRLDGAAMMARPAPGYGWTEEDAPRPRFAERLVPPADIPLPESRGAYPPRGPAPGPMPEPGRRSEPGLREAAPASANPYGINPDSGRPQPAPRKVARVAPSPELRPAEAKPALRDAPPAPRPTAARKPADPKADAPKPQEAKPQEAKPAETKPAEIKPADAKPVEAKAAEAKPSAPQATPAQDWKDPPETKRNVRVIGGATIVPGTAEKEGAAAQ